MGGSLRGLWALLHRRGERASLGYPQQSMHTLPALGCPTNTISQSAGVTMWGGLTMSGAHTGLARVLCMVNKAVGSPHAALAAPPSWRT